MAGVASIFLERRSQDDDLRRLLEQFMNIDSDAGAECTVPMDVVETSVGVEIVIDLVGIAADGVKIVVAHNTVLITGDKRAPACEHCGEAAFHVAERVFGRFARAAKLSGAFDVARADARLRDGELRVTLPRIEDRRGREHRIAVRID
jgi:HSP20 family protein